MKTLLAIALGLTLVTPAFATANYCGDGTTVLPEQCDDGNTVSGDGCSGVNCQIETGCGDGVSVSPDECDDHNTVDGDGCSSTCTVEAGYSCRGSEPSICTAETPTPLPEATAAEHGIMDAPTHVSSLELTILELNPNKPTYASRCIDKNYDVGMEDECRCLMFVTRISGTMALKAECPDGTIATLATW